MDCKYIDQNDIHELYLLDRLEDRTKKQYLKHLKECKSCFTEFEKQRLFISSVRNIGNREMKSEISRQVQELKAKKSRFDWDMILKVAAVFFFLVITPGLVYYYHTIESPASTGLYKPETMINETVNIGDTGTPMEEESSSLVNSKDKEKTSPAIKRVKLTESSSDVLSGTGSAGIEKSAKLVSRSKYKNNEKIIVDELISKKDSEPVAFESARAHGLIETKEILNPEKFYRPISVIKSDSRLKLQEQPIKLSQEDAKSKMTVSPKAISVARKNNIESYSANQMATAPLGNQKYSFDDLDTLEEMYKLKYQKDKRSFSIAVNKAAIELEMDQESSLPLSFPVIIQTSDSLHLEMTWFVNSIFLQINPEKIGINPDIDNFIYVQTPKDKIYEIRLSVDSTQAIMLK
ncbi:hypothetical protein ACFLSX_01115 [Calditrichota bacterium]